MMIHDPLPVNIYFIQGDIKSLNSDKFLRLALHHYSRIEGSAFRIDRGFFGKPQVMNFQNIHFNVSHTNDAIVCAVHDKPVGIDIERERCLNKGIVKRYFSPSEQSLVLLGATSQDEIFTRIWIMKEAYLKWQGTGLSDSINTIDTTCMKNIHVIRKMDYHIALCVSNPLDIDTGKIYQFLEIN